MRLLLDASEHRPLADLTATGVIAVTAADVPTLRSVQFKGRVVAIEPATDEDREVARRYVDAFFGDIERADGSRRVVLDRWVPPDHVACIVEVTDLFDQTPGPEAGASLRGPGR